MKKAQSQIITTVLIILIVLAAIIIVWAVIKNTVGSSTSEISKKTDCLNIDMSITEALAGSDNIKVLLRDKKSLSAIDVYVNGTKMNSRTSVAGRSALETITIPLKNETGDSYTLKSGDEVKIASLVGKGNLTCSNFADTKIVE